MIVMRAHRYVRIERKFGFARVQLIDEQFAGIGIGCGMPPGVLCVQNEFIDGLFALRRGHDFAIGIELLDHTFQPLRVPENLRFVGRGNDAVRPPVVPVPRISGDFLIVFFEITEEFEKGARDNLDFVAVLAVPHFNQLAMVFPDGRIVRVQTGTHDRQKVQRVAVLRKVFTISKIRLWAYSVS